MEQGLTASAVGNALQLLLDRFQSIETRMDSIEKERREGNSTDRLPAQVGASANPSTHVTPDQALNLSAPRQSSDVQKLADAICVAIDKSSSRDKDKD